MTGRLVLPELRAVDLDGPVAYREWEGPPDTTFVLVHGLGASHLSWLQVAPSLAGLGRVVAPDLPGFGETPRSGRGAGLMDLRRTLSRFIAEVGTGRLVLAGNSMGGGIALLHAAVEPASVDGLVLSSSVYPRASTGRPHPLVVAAFGIYSIPVIGDAVVDARVRRLPAERAVEVALWIGTQNPRAIPGEVVALLEDMVRRRQRDPDTATTFVEAARSLLRLGRRPDIARRALDHIACPVLVVHGREDRLVPADYAEAELRRHPEWRGRILAGVGHAPQMEAPGRWVSEVADWYASVFPPRSS